MAPGSRYHQVPRDSMESERDDAHEYLIPSPQSGAVEDIYDVSDHGAGAPAKGRGCYINSKVFWRVFSSMCTLTGFLLMILQGGGTFIPSAVFMMITLLFNIYMLLFTCASQFVTFSIFYGERDILDIGEGTFKRPNLSSYLDLAAAVGIFIPLTIAMVENTHYGPPVPSAIMGYIAIATQIVIAIPAIGSVRFSIRRVSGGVALKNKERPYSASRADKKISVMVGAIDADAVETSESTAIPAPLVAVEPRSEVAIDLV